MTLYGNKLDSIKTFFIKNPSKRYNDLYNKIRENVIINIINNDIPEQFYEDNDWKNIKNLLFTTINEYFKIEYDNIMAVSKGGRKYNFDFILEFYKNNNIIQKSKIEFKFNIDTISGAPQFVSPMYPSKYLTNNFEEYFYNNYLDKLTNYCKTNKPNKQDYITQIHKPKPEIVKELQDKYYKGCSKSSNFSNNIDDINFYKLCNQISQESINTFIQQTDIKLDTINEYLQLSQKDKIYLLFKDNQFKIEKPNMNDYHLIRFIKTKNTFICYNESNKQFKLLLRWKNGNGIAYPAFQIK